MNPTKLHVWSFCVLLTATLAMTSCTLDVPDAPAPVAESYCNRVVGPVDDPSALVFGAVLSLSGDNPDTGQRSLNAMTQAVAQINQTGIGGKHDARPLAFRVCDDAGLTDRAVLSARYLTDVFKTPAILGPVQSRSVLAVSQEVTIERGTLLISGSASSVDITNLDDNDLVWRTAPPDRDQPKALAYFTLWQLLEASSAGAGNDLQVGIVHANDNYGQDFSNTYQTSLSSLSSSSNLNISFETIQYDINDPDDITLKSVSLQQLLPNIQAVVFIGFEETADIIEQILDEPSFQSLPAFLSDGTRSTRLRTLFSDSSPPPSLLFGVNPGFRNTDAYNVFSNEYIDTFNTPPGAWTEHVYDATYLLAFAAAAVEGEPSGQDLAQALKLIQEDAGRKVEIGPADAPAAFRDMGEGNPIDVTGASGPLDFDPDTGEPASTGILRWNIDANTQEFIDCGVATIFPEGAQPERLWCNARCLPQQGDQCIPANAP